MSNSMAETHQGLMPFARSEHLAFNGQLPPFVGMSKTNN